MSASVALWANSVWAAPPSPTAEPPTLEKLQDYKTGEAPDPTQSETRRDLFRDAALSYGARGGLSHRTWELARLVDSNKSLLDRTFDFRALQVQAPSGLLMDAPVVIDNEGTAKFSADGQSAAVADRVIRIAQAASLTSAPPTWSDYINLTWDEVDPPPAGLLPRDSDERAQFKRWVADGWKEGVAQANDIYDEEVDRLTRDYVGRVRFRIFLAQQMVTVPYIDVDNRGTTGGPNELRINERQVVISGPSQIVTNPEKWTPAAQ